MIDTSGQWTKGFDRDEAYSLLELCINLNNPDVPGYDWDAGDWQAVYPATPKGAATALGPWENAWKLWKRGSVPNTYAIVIRGTIGARDSIIEDVITTSISAETAAIQAWDDGWLSFRLAATDRAETHLGFTYGLAVLLFAKDHGILKELLSNVPVGSRLMITGHSQGAAIATLLHAFLHYAINDPDDRYGLGARGYSLKTYVFAQPKPGNVQFALDFARIAGTRGNAFTINNSRDWVTEVPLSLEFLDEPGADLTAQLDGSTEGIAARAAFALFRKGLEAAQHLRNLVNQEVESASDTELQKWNRGTSQMEESFKTPNAPPHPKAASTNFTTVGPVIPVFGDPPGSPGFVADDALFQHHLPTYRRLMHTQLDMV